VPQTMLRVVFWNTGGKASADLIAEVVASQEANVVVLAECNQPIAQILDALAAESKSLWWRPWALCKRLTILTRFSDTFTRAEHESERTSIRSIRLPGLPDVMLAAAHLESRLWQSEQSQAFATKELLDDLVAVEARLGHQRTVLVGDFNMDPYDTGMLAAGALHGMMSKRTASRGSRKVQRRQYPMFYNPMWGLLGERSSGPPGSYRYWSAQHVCQEWHVFDQVLIRPALIECFPTDMVTILDTSGRTKLLNSKGYPSPSDHLPIVFEIHEPGVASARK
jgi:hypothetical protein